MVNKWIGYVGDGRILKIDTSDREGEEGEPTEVSAYRMRSAVLGGKTVFENGQAFVYAGGDKLATSYEVGIPSPALATMWHHKDPNMSSYRSTEPGGTVLGTGVDFNDWDKIETDADGKSVGLTAPVSFPTHSNELYTSGWSFGSLVNGQYVTYSVDGLHVPPEHFAQIFQLAFRDMFSVMAWQARISVPRLKHNFVFSEQDGFELYPNTPEGLRQAYRTEMRNPQWHRVWEVNDSWVISLTDIPLIWASTAEDRKSISYVDQTVLRKAVKDLLTPECRAFISKLISTTKEINDRLWKENENDRDARFALWLHEPRDEIYNDILWVFDHVIKQNGFHGSVSANVSTVGGSIAGGNAGVYLANFVGWADTQKAARTLNMNARDGARVYRDKMRRQAITTIHELLHFNFGDRDLARAVAAIREEELPDISDSLEASKYWHKELEKHCYD